MYVFRFYLSYKILKQNHKVPLKLTIYLSGVNTSRLVQYHYESGSSKRAIHQKGKSQKETPLLSKQAMIKVPQIEHGQGNDLKKQCDEREHKAGTSRSESPQINRISCCS